MRHPLAPHERSEAQAIGYAWIGAIVRNVGGDTLLIQAGDLPFPILNRNARFAPLPPRFRVFVTNGWQMMRPFLPREGTRLWLSVGTVDPLHLLIESAELPVRLGGLRSLCS